MSNIYNIPAGFPFAKSLAQKLLQDHETAPETLADILILLPTRRACRTLRESFLQINNGKPILLPRMQALGDIDEEELSLSIAGQSGAENLINLPPPLPPLRRQILLARAIIARPDFTQGFDQALSLSKALGHLMDQIYTEGLDMKNLAALVPEEFADHWQITLDFLKILSEEWPEILGNLGVIDIADHRNRLINTLADFWQNHPPQTHIIAAGSTGSIPATAALLKTISTLPNGQIILPGLDQNIDDESWDAIGESHPQFGFKHLLTYIGAPRQDVKTWQSGAENAPYKNRQNLAGELMRPAETTKAWQNLRNNNAAFENAFENLKLYDCETQSEEALTIATLMRSILEEPTKTAALITPDRTLAKRVSMALRRWDITIDDSAGLPLTQTQTGKFLMLTAEACETGLAPSSLLSLLKNSLQNKVQNIDKFEEFLLRGTKPPSGFAGLWLRLEQFEIKHNRKEPDLHTLIATLEKTLSPLLALYETDEKTAFSTILRTHLKTCETLSKIEDDTHPLWAGEDGQNIAAFFSSLFEHIALFPDIHAHNYTGIIRQFLDGQTIRPAYGTHPRLQILGQLEARLIDAGLVILGGLNEGSWPPDTGHDPWMSRPMRQEFGLPGSERSIGLAAHDFVQGFCAPNVALTRAARIDHAPTVPARWLQRLKTVMHAASIPQDLLHNKTLQNWITNLDHTDEIMPTARPAPTPPLASRPHRVSVTKIETWLKDPYALYAYYVLNLQTLEPLEKQADAAIRGQILHATLDKFVSAHPDHIPENAQNILHNFAHEQLEEHHIEPSDWAFYWPRFAKITKTYLQKEQEWRKNAAPLKTEIKGETHFNTKTGDFILHGRADRIDRLQNGNAAIIDYKSGGQFSKTSMENGNTPQLPLEALIVQHGGFENTNAMPCNYLGYWTLNASEKYTEITDTQNILQETETALKDLVETFDNPETPYYSLPRVAALPRFNDYEHLARVKEWAALDDNEDAA